MIDERKIEKVADKKSGKPGGNEDCQTSAGRISFMDSVQEEQENFINSLWHNTSEKPEGYNDWVIIKYDGLNFVMARQIKEIYDNWETIVMCMAPAHWCYLSDILP